MLAPIAGEAVERLAGPGQVIQAGATQVFTISNMSSVCVLTNIYQKDLPYVHPGDPVTITTDSYLGTELHGKIFYIAAALDPTTRTLQARTDVKNPQGMYSQFLAAKEQLSVIGPLAVLLIFLILFALYGNFKFSFTITLGVVLTEPVGALVALKLTNTPFRVSLGLGLLALMGVSVETAVILVSYINKLRLEGKGIREATHEASLLRLRPIMMTALVACLGLLPAAMSHGIGSDTQRPFAIVIVAGLLSRLLLGFFVNPVLYELVARPDDVPQV